MNGKKLEHNFTSYINVSPKNNGDKNGAIQEVKPKLLNGELVTAAAHNVVMLTPLSERDRGRYGSLFVTNYRLSFLPLETSPSDECSQRNSLLGVYDIPLTGVNAVWQTDGGPTRRRKLAASVDMPSKVKGMQVVCKNMKVLTFSFANSPLGKGRMVAMALLHHAFPKRHDLLFAYEYREPYYPTLPADMNMFIGPGEWKRELERCGSPHWRMTCINGTSDAFMLTAPETLIVPAALLDYSLMEHARHFRGGRVPIWVWGRSEGGCLLRAGELLSTDLAHTAESVLLEQVRKSHPKLTPPHVIYLCGNNLSATSSNQYILPPLAALQTSYKKLVEICTPTTLTGFWTGDSMYYSELESSRWIRHVATSLHLADLAADRLHHNVTTVLVEGEGVDYCAVVSSLSQLLLDGSSRSLSGFQSLVQKEWVALGHPFADRLGLPRPGGLPKEPRDPREPPSQIAPVFLLFLDCVHQLLHQFPDRFQFTETYLTTLWDCTHNHLFDTFLFNCMRDRELAVSKDFVQRPVWDWGEQFSEQDIALFYNPLYVNKPKTSLPNQRISYMPASSKPSKEVPVIDRLQPCTSVAAMELWSQCYERWLLPLDAPSTGVVQYHVHNYMVLSDIRRLREKLNSLSIMNNKHSNGEEPPEPITPRSVSRFYPFSGVTTSKTTLESLHVSVINPSVDPSELLDSQSLLNAPD